MTPFTIRTLSLLILAIGLRPAMPERRTHEPTRVARPAAPIGDALVHELCGKRVALLGEAPMHGYGKTLELKVEVARRLVEECHYTGFFIESGAYDFLRIRKEMTARHTITQSSIAAAIGGLWATREVEPLIPFLLEKAQDGVLTLGGLDDQLGRGTYAQRQMPADLAEYIRGNDKSRCLAVFQRHTLWQYTNEAPYGPKDKALILGCADKIDAALSSPRGSVANEDELAMIANLKRTLARDFREDAQAGVDFDTQNVNDRDHSMYTNFRWWMSHLPANSKVIVWTATNHAAKSLSGVAGREKFVSLGSYIHREFNTEAFVLGMSALSGTYGMARQPVRTLVAAPDSSVEARAFGTGDADIRYFSQAELRRLGSVPARPLGADFKTAHWDDVLDGLVVFREERPPHFSGQ